MQNFNKSDKSYLKEERNNEKQDIFPDLFIHGTCSPTNPVEPT